MARKRGRDGQRQPLNGGAKGSETTLAAFRQLFAVRQAIARQVPGAVHITKEREPDRAAAFRAEVEAIDKRSQAEDARWERRGSDWQPRCGARGVRSSTARADSHVFAQASVERVPDLSFRRFRPVLDLGKKLRLDPDAFVSDPLGVGLSLSDEAPTVGGDRRPKPCRSHGRPCRRR